MRSTGAILLLVLTVGCTRNAPAWTTVDDEATLQTLGSSGSITMARVRLTDSEAFRFAAGPCQEVMVLVERGLVRAELMWFRAGDAARFEAPTVLQAMSDGGAEIFAVAVTHVVDEPADWSSAPESESCGLPLAPMTRAAPDRRGPFAVSGGQSNVRIYLDAPDSSRELASLVAIEGSTVPTAHEHVHEHSAEALWVEQGTGTMRIGDETHDLQPGTFLFIPSGTPHDLVLTGDAPFIAYQVYAPAGPEQRFRRSTARHP